MPAPGEPLEIICEAPPYGVVRATRDLELEAPEDVRWLEAGKLLQGQGLPVPPLLFRQWNESLAGRPTGLRCSCGAGLPLLHSYLFTLESGLQHLYAFGQCRHCKTIYWTRE